MTPHADAAARTRIRTALDTTLVVEAAAGTGKTTELVHRIVATLGAGRTTVDRLVAVTFTEKAAGELKLRLRAGLETARHGAPAGSDARRHYEAALTRLEEARLGTIHGLCADLLRERPVEARIDPQFRVLSEAEAERLHREAFTRWLQRQLEAPPEGLRRALRRASRYGEDSPVERLCRASWTLAGWRDFPARWSRPPFARAAALTATAAAVTAFADLSTRGASDDPLVRDTAPARRLRDAWQRRAAVAGRDDDAVEAALVELAGDRDFGRPRRGRGRFFAKEISRQSVLEAHAELLAALAAFQRTADADLAVALQAELGGAVAAYEALKERGGALDFVDLLVRTRDLLREQRGVRAEAQGRCTHLFVDEFQDTDPLQAEILLLLAADDPSVDDWRAVRPVPGKLFLVGDPKQSIYRFRRADVAVYQAVKTQLLAAGAECVALTTSFRATPALQAFLNTAFAPHMRGDAAALQAAYVPLAPYRADADAQPAIIALPVPRPYGRQRVTKTAIEASLPDAVGAFVDWLVRDSGWTVCERERPEARVALRPRHVCLLFRRFDSFFAGDVTRPYVRALEARGLPHLLVGGRSFHEREEIETMRAALTAIEWPEDELALYATLRGSLFAIGDEELLLYRAAHGPLHPFRLPSAALDEAQAPIVEALRVLAELRRGGERRAIADTVAHLLEATRAHAAFALRPSGEQALANVLHLAELARAYERDGAVSFRGFVERLSDDAARRGAAEAPVVEEGSEGVRIMTVHRAKGLEFPVVVLADITAGLTGGVTRWIDPERGGCALKLAGWAPAELLAHAEEEGVRDSAEGVRVAYVAATRARDLLVVPAVGDEPFESGWIGVLNGALYPPAQPRSEPAPAAGCPRFGRDTVLSRPPDFAFTTGGVSPGAYDGDGYRVVWWDPAILGLDAAPRYGLRQEELLDKRVSRDLVDAGLEAYRTWEAARASARTQGGRAAQRVQTATDYAAASPEMSAVELIELPRAAGRPRGARFGALVHAVLATVALDAEPAAVAAVATVHGRTLGASEEEVMAAGAAVTAALAHPLFAQVRAAGVCRRETPVAFTAADGTIVDGIVDLAFRGPAEWVVVDFKTDDELSPRLDVYRRQVTLYARGIAAATGEPTRAVLLKV